LKTGKKNRTEELGRVLSEELVLPMQILSTIEFAGRRLRSDAGSRRSFIAIKTNGMRKRVLSLSLNLRSNKKIGQRENHW